MSKAKGEPVLRITPAAEWKPQTVLFKLPSGRVVRLRPVEMDVFLRLARIPDSLTPLVLQRFAPITGKTTEDDVSDFDALKNTMEFMNIICEFTVVEPKVILDREPDYTRGEISIDDIPFDDKQAITLFFNNPGDALRPFRTGPSSDVEPVRDEQDDGAGPVGDSPVTPLGE